MQNLLFKEATSGALALVRILEFGNKIGSKRVCLCLYQQTCTTCKIMTVKDLMMPNSKVWNYEVLCGMFEANRVSTIMNTPLFAPVNEDTIVWKLEHNGTT